jgi:hypothetical protein
MKTLAVAIAAVAILAGHARADCGAELKSFWDKLEQRHYAGVSPQQLAELSRMALRAYDICMAGDAREAGMLFGKLALLHDQRDQSTGPYNPNEPPR